jgi:hypothetical protein
MDTTLPVRYRGWPGRDLDPVQSEWPDAHGKQQGRHHEEQQEEGEDTGDDAMVHGFLSYTMSKRSAWSRSAGTPR